MIRLKILTLALLATSLLTSKPEKIEVPSYTPSTRYVLCHNSIHSGLLLLKKLEGIRLHSYWDVNAYRVGWGTKGRKGERISVKEADRRAAIRYMRSYAKVARDYPMLDSWQVSGFAVMLYNTGSFGPRLDRALRRGDIHTAGRIMMEYTYTAGRHSRGLLRRRAAELAYLNTKGVDRNSLIVNLLREVEQKKLKELQKSFAL